MFAFQKRPRLLQPELAARRLVWKAIREEPTMNVTLKRLWEEGEGQDLTEYALLMVLIALVSVASMQTIGTTISNVFSNAAVNLSPS